MSQSVEYKIAPFDITLRVIFVGDRDELLDEYLLSIDIEDVGSKTVRHELVDDRAGRVYWAISCVFYTGIPMTVGRISKESYWATEVLFRHLGEESDCYSTKYAIISWIANAIDQQWCDYDLHN